MTNIKQQLLSGLDYISSLDLKGFRRWQFFKQTMNDLKVPFKNLYATISVVKVVQDIISSIFLDTFYSKFINKSTVTKWALIFGKWRVCLYGMVEIGMYAGTVQHACSLCFRKCSD